MEYYLRRIVLEMYRLGIIKFGEFKLSCGAESPFYIDLRIAYSYPHLIRRIVELIINTFSIRRFEGIVGIATSGIALAAYIAALTGLPLGYVRNEKKEHGTESYVEGELRKRKVVVVDDVATTGKTIVKAIEKLREYGAKPVMAIVVVDREQGASRNIEMLGVSYRYLLNTSYIMRILKEENLISESLYQKILTHIELSKTTSTTLAR